MNSNSMTNVLLIVVQTLTNIYRVWDNNRILFYEKYAAFVHNIHTSYARICFFIVVSNKTNNQWNIFLRIKIYFIACHWPFILNKTSIIYPFLLFQHKFFIICSSSLSCYDILNKKERTSASNRTIKYEMKWKILLLNRVKIVNFLFFRD